MRAQMDSKEDEKVGTVMKKQTVSDAPNSTSTFVNTSVVLAIVVVAGIVLVLLVRKRRKEEE